MSRFIQFLNSTLDKGVSNLLLKELTSLDIRNTPNEPRSHRQCRETELHPSIVPLENKAMEGRTVIQWDKNVSPP